MAKIGDEKPQTLIAISDKTLNATCLGFHVLLLIYCWTLDRPCERFNANYGGGSGSKVGNRIGL